MKADVLIYWGKKEETRIIWLNAEQNKLPIKWQEKKWSSQPKKTLKANASPPPCPVL